MNNALETAIAAITPALIETRHDIHRHPELSGHEERTAALVAARLRALGMDVRTGVGGHGVIGELRGAKEGRTFALRADMDALPMREEGTPPYQSGRPGVMHACGHDGHTTCLLGAAEVLAGQRDTFAGTVRFLFQPAEETGAGAKKMCEGGAMDGADAVVALHAWPPLPVGQIGIRPGAMTASADTFEILVRGKGAHAAYPHLGIDPIVTAAQITLALQTLASREIEPTEPVVVTVGEFAAGSAPNIIPESARLAGTIRTHAHHVRQAIPERLRRIAEGLCTAARATCDVHFREGTPPVVNAPEIAQLIADAAGEALGPGNVFPLPSASMGAEDFAFYLEHAPGALFRLGLGNPTPLHSPLFDFTDAAIPVGVRVLSATALRFLAPHHDR